MWYLTYSPFFDRPGGPPIDDIQGMVAQTTTAAIFQGSEGRWLLVQLDKGIQHQQLFKTLTGVKRYLQKHLPGLYKACQAVKFRSQARHYTARHNTTFIQN